MNKKIIAAIVAAATILSVMGCSDEDQINETATETVEESGNTDVEMSSGEETSIESIDVDSEYESLEDTDMGFDETSSENSAPASNASASAQDPSAMLGKTVKVGEAGVYENSFLNLKMNLPNSVWLSEDDYFAKKNNVSVDEWPATAMQKVESGSPVLVQYAGLDMDSFKVTIYKDNNFNQDKYLEIATNDYKNTNGDLPPTNITSETRSVNFLGESHDVYTFKGTLGEENYIANYLFYSKDGYVYQFELSGFADFIDYFGKATSLN